MSHSRQQTLKILLTIAAPFLLATACSKSLGYGVLLWSEDERMIPSGSFVTVVSESNIQDTYEFRANGIDGTTTVPRWRIDFFETEEEAAAEAAGYADLATTYARSTRNALPMRNAPELKNDNIVYRLRDGEVIKLVSRDPEPSDLSGLVSYWYTALTETGVRAYVFGYELDLFDPLDPSADLNATGNVDPLVQLLLGNVWRPIYFVDMITNHAYDLDLFRPEYGMFPDPENKTLELVLPYHSLTFNYEQITEVGPRKYLAEGTNLQLTFNRGEELSIQYMYDGEQYILALQRVPGDIQEYVDTELQRREDEYMRILETGPAFSSGSYGRITLLEDRRFIWSGYERLVPTAIPQSLGTGGQVLMNLYLGEALKDSFDGAISFKFDGAPNPVVFAYLIVPNGMRMMYVPPTDIDEFVVTGPGAASITLFFSTGG